MDVVFSGLIEPNGQCLLGGRLELIHSKSLDHANFWPVWTDSEFDNEKCFQVSTVPQAA